MLDSQTNFELPASAFKAMLSLVYSTRRIPYDHLGSEVSPPNCLSRQCGTLQNLVPASKGSVSAALRYS